MREVGGDGRLLEREPGQLGDQQQRAGDRRRRTVELDPAHVEEDQVGGGQARHPGRVQRRPDVEQPGAQQQQAAQRGQRHQGAQVPRGAIDAVPGQRRGHRHGRGRRR